MVYLPVRPCVRKGEVINFQIQDITLKVFFLFMDVHNLQCHKKGKKKPRHVVIQGLSSLHLHLVMVRYW